MKLILKPLAFLLFAFITNCASAQDYFEGRIHYEHEVKAKSKKVDLARVQKVFGSGSTLSFKEGNFRHDYDGGITEFDMYRKSDNRQYMKKRGNDTIYWYDCSNGGVTIKELKPLGQKKEILRIVCDQLSIRYSEYSKVEYYNSDSLSIDPNWFTAFKRNEQYKVDALERSIYLRSETEYPAITFISQATKVQHQVVAMDVFEIPSNAILLRKK
jgi:hypothetical protein